MLVDPLGRIVPRGKAEASKALGVPLGKVGSSAALSETIQYTARKLCPSQSQPLGFSPRPACEFDRDPQPLDFSPQPAYELDRDPQPIGFSPRPACEFDRDPQPLGFRPETNSCLPRPEASICSLPLAALACKAVREQATDGAIEEADLVVEDLGLCARPGGMRIAGEHLDQVTVELRHLCDQLRQGVLDAADEGLDCSLEVQELNRLVVLEEELGQELAAARGDAPLRDNWPEERVSEMRLCSAQSDVGGGCEAVVEGRGETDPPSNPNCLSGGGAQRP